MKSHLSYLVIGMAVAAILSSCSVDHRSTEPSGITAPPADNSAEWTILYYGAGNNAADLLSNGQSQTAATVHGLQNAYTTDQVHAVALTGTAADNGRCRFYDIEFQPGEAGNRIRSTAADWGQQDMSSPQLLKQFVDSATALYPARHYALIIGGQGEAWRGACRDDANGGRVMSMPAIYQSLDATTSQNGLPIHFDVLLWLTPGMGTMEVAYEMRGKADFMVATSSFLAQPGFMATGAWLLDLAADPGMTAERLGRFMVARMVERAGAAQDTLSTFNLLDLRYTEALAQNVSELADSMRITMQGHSAQILQIWQSLWDMRTSDSAAIDLPAFVDAIRADSSFYSVAGIRQAADRVQSALDHVLIDRRSTRAGNLRKGFGIYSPMATSLQDLESYNALQMSSDEPGWAAFLVAMQESGTVLVQANGSIHWAGHTLQNLYLFLNIAQTGTAVYSLVTPVTITDAVIPDNVRFGAALALDGDSVSAYLGAFQDMDHDRLVSPGDRIGYFHINTGSRDWITIHSGDSLDSLQIELTRTL